MYLRFILICVFFADPSQPFFHGGTPSYGEAYRREKADSRRWGEHSLTTDNYNREHLFVTNICVYCRKMKRFVSFEGCFEFFFYFKISKFLSIYPHDFSRDTERCSAEL
jgi:hypothetical protein